MTLRRRPTSKSAPAARRRSHGQRAPVRAAPSAFSCFSFSACPRRRASGRLWRRGAAAARINRADPRRRDAAVRRLSRRRRCCCSGALLLLLLAGCCCGGGGSCCVVYAARPAAAAERPAAVGDAAVGLRRLCCCFSSCGVELWPARLCFYSALLCHSSLSSAMALVFSHSLLPPFSPLSQRLPPSN